ncbi:uncharacterized protein LOC129611688 [Condylostylus longicornis]|uniref:uncharacterized protein LOC129611688 n=1 Tax=Condylostylus longicornis TaxID=2530218 RepID=UPI00244DEEB2|nr:uncharacterized protein LOC129611688 [Condylostylus longicornis]
MSDKNLIENVIQKNKGYVPILVKFQNGILNDYGTFKTGIVLANNKNLKKDEAVFSINKHIYHGPIEPDEKQAVNSYIAVKRRNKIHLMEIDQCTLIHDIHSHHDCIEKINNKELAMRVLMKNFGGKKSKVYFERTERSKVNLEIIKSQLNKTIEETTLQDDNDKTSELEIVPPYNKNAKNSSDIYILTNILEEDFLSSLQEEAVAVFNYNTEDLPISSQYILKEIRRVKDVMPKSQCFTFLKVLIYLDGLLNYIKIKRRNIDGVELSKISEKISNDIRRRFAPKDLLKPLRTTISTDKAICYFIVLIMLIQPDYEIDINILTTEIGRPKNKVKSLCSAVFAKQKQFSDMLCFSLANNSIKGKHRMVKRKTL